MLIHYLNHIKYLKKKLYMNISKELERLLQRVNKSSNAKAPPTLRMIMVKNDYLPMDLFDLFFWKGNSINL